MKYYAPSMDYKHQIPMDFPNPQTKHCFDFSNSPEDSEEEEDDYCNFPTFQHPGTSHSYPFTPRNCTSVGHIASVEVGCDKVGMTIVTEIDRAIKEYFDNLLHKVDGLSARLSQLESKMHQIENAVDDLKESAEFNHGRTDRQLRQLENILVEVEDGILFLKDKQEIAEAQFQLAKLQGSLHNRPSEDRSYVGQNDSILKLNQPIASSGAPLLAHPTPSPSAPVLTYPVPPPAGAPIAAQVTSQLPQSSFPSLAQSYYQPTGHNLESTYPQFYQSVPQPPRVSQPQQQSQHHLPLAFNPQSHPPLNHHFEETQYMPSYGRLFSRPNMDFPTGYSRTPEPANFSGMHPYDGALSSYGNSTMEKLKGPPSPSILSGGSDYTRLPKAQILPHALPTASIIANESGSVESREKVRVDDIIEKVTSMGFRRDLARATVKKLVDSGSSVDLNVVLDKLMGNGNVNRQDGR